MKINTTNLVATEALWTALVNQADHRVSLQDGERLKSLLPYQVYACQYDSGKQRLIIMGNNKAYAVDRKVGVEEVTYEIASGSIMAEIVHDTLGFETEGVIQSDCYLSGLIEFISNYRQPQGRATRERIAELEVVSEAEKEKTAVFNELLAGAPTLTAHSFYNRHDTDSDRHQLIASPKPNIDAGVYSYASFDGAGVPDTLVFVSETNRNVAIAYIDVKGVAIEFAHPELRELLGEVKPQAKRVLNGLVSPDSIISRIFDLPVSTEPKEHSHDLNDLIASLKTASYARSSMMLAGMVRQFRDAFPSSAVVLDEICQGCGNRH